MSRAERKLVSLRPEQRIAAARAAATQAMPYLTTGILDLIPRPVEGLGTMGVTANGILLYDEEVLAQLTPSEAGTILIHEYLHVWLRHAERVEALIRSGFATNKDRDTLNVAADCEINDDLEAAGLPLPHLPDSEGNLLPPQTPKLHGLPEGRTFEEYAYALLERKRKNQSQQPPQGDPPPQQPPSDSSQGGGEGGWGQCGSGGGNPLPSEAKHAPEDDPIARTPLDQEVTGKAVAEAIANAGKKQGSVPLGLLLEAEALLKPERIPWESLFAHVARNAVAYASGGGEMTYSRRSRRQAFYDELYEPAPIAAGTHEPLAEIAFCADTSGSMIGEVERVMGLARDVLKHLNGAQLTFLACDAKVHSVARLRSLQDIQKHYKGGGGTDFRPAFEAIEKLSPRPDVLVYVTDGYGAYPREKPLGVEVVWLVVDGGEIRVDWGTVIEIQENDD